MCRALDATGSWSKRCWKGYEDWHGERYRAVHRRVHQPSVEQDRHLHDVHQRHELSGAVRGLRRDIRFPEKAVHASGHRYADASVPGAGYAKIRQGAQHVQLHGTRTQGIVRLAGLASADRSSWVSWKFQGNHLPNAYIVSGLFVSILDLKRFS